MIYQSNFTGSEEDVLTERHQTFSISPSPDSPRMNPSVHLSTSSSLPAFASGSEYVENHPWLSISPPQYGWDAEQQAIPSSLLRAGSVDVIRLPHEQFPIARRHRSATPAIRRNRISASHPTTFAHLPTSFLTNSPLTQMGSSAAIFSDQLQTINNLARPDDTLHVPFGQAAKDSSDNRFIHPSCTSASPVGCYSPLELAYLPRENDFLAPHMDPYSSSFISPQVFVHESVDHP